jgi:hypothetical protein
MKYYLPTKKKEIIPFSGKWMALMIIMLIEMSQTRKDKYCRFSLRSVMQNKTKKELYECESRTG